MPDFPNHPLADELAPGGVTDAPLIALAGFLGASQREGYRRLYLTPTFDDYIEFRAEDLRHVEAGDQGQPLAAQLVWLRRDAEITRARVEQRKLQGDWLRGELASEFQAAGRGIGLGVAAGGLGAVGPITLTRGPSVCLPCPNGSAMRCDSYVDCTALITPWELLNTPLRQR